MFFQWNDESITVVRQPNGKYCIWNKGEHRPEEYNLTKAELYRRIHQEANKLARMMIEEDDYFFHQIVYDTPICKETIDVITSDFLSMGYTGFIEFGEQRELTQFEKDIIESLYFGSTQTVGNGLIDNICKNQK